MNMNDARGDQQIAEASPDVGRNACRPHEVALARHSADVKHTTAVERLRGDQVEEEQADVDVAEPGGDGVGLVRRPGDQRDADEQDAEHERDEWAGDRDAELGAGAPGTPLKLATPPKSQSVMPSISMPSRRACSA